MEEPNYFMPLDGFTASTIAAALLGVAVLTFQIANPMPANTNTAAAMAPLFHALLFPAAD